jgi:FixJ family two-component response regulator
MLSAMGDEILINQAKSVGVKYFLSKPFKAEDLLNLVISLVEGKV